MVRYCMLYMQVQEARRCCGQILYIIYASAGGKEVLWSDTVGFIQKLPTKLVSSFRATLEELEDAALVLN